MKQLVIMMLVTLMVGCAATGSNLKGNVYHAGQVNRAQMARSIQILEVLPAQVEVDNSKQKQQAQVGGAILGAVAGGLGGGFGGLGGWGTAGTTVAGGAIGAAAGSMVNDKVLVQGVTIMYRENGNGYSSTQVGQPCEFRPGVASIITTEQNETRIQANATCPVER